MAHPSGFSGQSMPPYGPEDEYTYVSGFGFVPTPPDVAERQNLRSHGNLLGLSFLIYYLMLAFAPRLLTFFFASLMKNSLLTNDGVLLAHPAVYQLINIILSVIVYLIPFLVIYRLSVKEKKSNAFPFRIKSRGIMALSVPITMAVSVIGIVGTRGVISIASWMNVNVSEELTIITPTDPVALVLFFINATVVPAIMEELVFRGAIMQSLRKLSDSMALFVTTCLFSLSHMSFVKLPYTFLLGLCIGYFVLRTGSILTGMLIHFCHNFYVLLSQIVISNLPVDFIPLIRMTLNIFLLMVGLIALILMIYTYENTFTLRPNHGYLRVYEQIRSFTAAPFMMIAGAFLVLAIVYPYLTALG